jgi:hypothetical protein
VGFNMSWVLVDGINEDALYEALDLAATDETPDPHDLGTSYVPLAGAALKSGGGALYSRSTPWSWTRLWGRARRGLRGCRLDPDVSRVWSWSTRWSHTQASGKMAASLGKFDMTPVKDADIWRFAGTCLLHSETFAPSQWTSSEPRMHAVNQAIGAWTISSMCRLTQRLRSLGTATTAQLRTTSSKICGRLYQPMGTF